MLCVAISISFSLLLYTTHSLSVLLMQVGHTNSCCAACSAWPRYVLPFFFVFFLCFLVCWCLCQLACVAVALLLSASLTHSLSLFLMYAGAWSIVSRGALCARVSVGALPAAASCLVCSCSSSCLFLCLCGFAVAPLLSASLSLTHTHSLSFCHVCRCLVVSRYAVCAGVGAPPAGASWLVCSCSSSCLFLCLCGFAVACSPSVCLSLSHTHTHSLFFSCMQVLGRSSPAVLRVRLRIPAGASWLVCSCSSSCSFLCLFDAACTFVVVGFAVLLVVYVLLYSYACLLFFCR